MQRPNEMALRASVLPLRAGARAARPFVGRLRATAVALAAISTSAGCSLVKPEARATSASIGRSTGDVAEVAIELELANPGRDEIELVEYDYVVRLADGASYGGRWAALRALPPEQTVRATIPAVLPVESLRDGATSWRIEGVLRYRDPMSVARILYEAGFLETKVPFGGSGTALARGRASDDATSAEATSRPGEANSSPRGAISSPATSNAAPTDAAAPGRAPSETAPAPSGDSATAEQEVAPARPTPGE